MSKENKIVWEQIYYKSDLINYKGGADETWRASIVGGWLIRHVHYDLNEGDQSNRTETMVFVRD